MATKRATAASKDGGDIKCSIIVPAYKEGANVRPLVTQVFQAVDEHEKASGGKGVVTRNSVEMIYVDDNSGDSTEQEVSKLSKEGYPVRIIIRKTERGLSSAVTRGFDEAVGSLLLCMDADLQHPPTKVPEMFETLAKTNAEFVIGTRYGEGVEIDKNWPLYRQIISKGARALSLGLTPLSDPMTGFFGLPKAVYKRGKNVSNVGFKIALELFVKCDVKKSVEVPFSFGLRLAGESKLSGKVIIKYLEQLWQLYTYKYPWFIFVIIALVLIALALLYVAATTVF